MPGNERITMGKWSIEFRDLYYPLAYELHYDCSDIDDYEYAGIVIMPELSGYRTFSRFDVGIVDLYDTLKVFPHLESDTPESSLKKFIVFTDLKLLPLSEEVDEDIFFPFHAFNCILDMKPGEKGKVDSYLSTDLRFGCLCKKMGENKTASAYGQLNLSKGIYTLQSLDEFAENAAQTLAYLHITDEETLLEEVLAYLESENFERDTGYTFDKNEIDFYELADDYEFINLRTRDGFTPAISLRYIKESSEVEIGFIESDIVNQMRKGALNKFISDNYGDNRGITLGLENVEYYIRDRDSKIPPSFYLTVNALLISKSSNDRRVSYTCHSGIKFSFMVQVNYQDSLYDIIPVKDNNNKFVNFIDKKSYGPLCRKVESIGKNIKEYYQY